MNNLLHILLEYFVYDRKPSKQKTEVFSNIMYGVIFKPLPKQNKKKDLQG